MLGLFKPGMSDDQLPVVKHGAAYTTSVETTYTND